MGGTTAKAGLIENGEVRHCAGQEVGTGMNISRVLKGGGYFIGAATVDLAEVGAGGGSIAWLDDATVLKVGPESAGAVPGPIAYGMGGDRVTSRTPTFCSTGFPRIISSAARCGSMSSAPVAWSRSHRQAARRFS